MKVAIIELAIMCAAIGVGALVQGSVGFGLALTAVPIIGLLEPTALPATVLLVSLPMTALMAMRERGHIDVKGFVQIVIARVPGTLVAIWLLSLISGAEIAIVVGVVVTIASLLSIVAPNFEVGTSVRLFAGVMSGFMGTIAAVGGPPLALAYQRRPGPELRATLAVSFVVGTTVSLVALAVAGHIHARHLVLTAVLLPPLILGLMVSRRLHAFLDKSWLRSAVLVFAALSGIATIINGVL